jgi:hypothetical protein
LPAPCSSHLQRGHESFHTNPFILSRWLTRGTRKWAKKRWKKRGQSRAKTMHEKVHSLPSLSYRNCPILHNAAYTFMTSVVQNLSLVSPTSLFSFLLPYPCPTTTFLVGGVHFLGTLLVKGTTFFKLSQLR